MSSHSLLGGMGVYCHNWCDLELTFGFAVVTMIHLILCLKL